jgi:hypothetical protein
MHSHYQLSVQKHSRVCQARTNSEKHVPDVKYALEHSHKHAARDVLELLQRRYELWKRLYVSEQLVRRVHELGFYAQVSKFIMSCIA